MDLSLHSGKTTHRSFLEHNNQRVFSFLKLPIKRSYPFQVCLGIYFRNEVMNPHFINCNILTQFIYIIYKVTWISILTTIGVWSVSGDNVYFSTIL